MIAARRNLIHHLACDLLEIVKLEGDHCRARLHAPAIAASAQPGQFVNVRFPSAIGAPIAFNCYRDLVEYHRTQSPVAAPFLLARPFGVHRVGTAEGWVEILFKVLGRGTRVLSEASAGAQMDVLGPIGNPFDLSGRPQTAILVAGGTGVAPLYLLAQRLSEAGAKLVVLIGTGHAIPMAVSDSDDVVHFVDRDVTAVADEYAALGAVVRIATIEPRKGCFRGTSVDLLSQYLARQPGGRDGVREIFSCGPWAMQAKVAELAREEGVQCQVLLEERMGCGLGACMACVCKIRQESGEYKYRRVCVDGPVFRAEDVGWTQRE